MRIESKRVGSSVKFRAKCSEPNCNTRTGWFYKAVDVRDTMDLHVETSHKPKVEDEGEGDGQASQASE